MCESISEHSVAFLCAISLSCHKHTDNTALILKPDDVLPFMKFCASYSAFINPDFFRSNVGAIMPTFQNCVRMRDHVDKVSSLIPSI